MKKLLTIIVLTSTMSSTQAHNLRAVAALVRLAAVMPHAVDAQAVARVTSLKEEYEKAYGEFAKNAIRRNEPTAAAIIQAAFVASLAYRAESWALNEMFTGVPRVTLQGVAKTLNAESDRVYWHYSYITTRNKYGEGSPEHRRAADFLAGEIARSFLVSILGE